MQAQPQSHITAISSASKSAYHETPSLSNAYADWFEPSGDCAARPDQRGADGDLEGGLMAIPPKAKRGRPIVHGRETKIARAQRREVRALIRMLNQLIATET